MIVYGKINTCVPFWGHDPHFCLGSTAADYPVMTRFPIYKLKTIASSYDMQHPVAILYKQFSLLHVMYSVLRYVQCVTQFVCFFQNDSCICLYLKVFHIYSGQQMNRFKVLLNLLTFNFLRWYVENSSKLFQILCLSIKLIFEITWKLCFNFCLAF